MKLPERLSSGIVTLRRYTLDDVAAVKESTTASHETLKPWMPWAQELPTDESVLDFVGPSARDFHGDGDTNYAITLSEDGTFVGGCGLMPRIGPNALEIGYWVDIRHMRRGIATTAAQLLTDAAFSIPTIVRTEIRCDERNVASAAIPNILGYRLDRIEAGGMIWVLDRS